MAHQKISDLPNSWIVTKLPDAIDLILGQSPASSDCNSDGHGLPFFQGKTEFGKVYPKVRKYCTAPKKLAEKNDVLLSVRAPVGPTNLATEKCAIGRGLAALRTNSDIDFKYLLFYMRHIELWLSEQGTGSTFKAVSGVFLKELDFFVSPLPEQKRIVEKLDSLLAQVDTIQQRLNNLPDIIKRFRQSVLAAAVSGKLTEQWHGSKATDFEQSPITIGESEALTPKGWKWQKLLDLAKLESGHTPRKTVEEYWENGDVYWICLQDIRAAHGTIIKDTKYKPTMLGIENSSARLLPAGTVCFSRDISVGFTTIMGHEMSTTQHFANWICGGELINKYLMFSLMAAKTHITDSGQGTTVKTVYMPALKEFRLLTPPLSEQTEIVRLVEQYFALADTLEKNLANAKQRVDSLTQSILAKAFRGELVPQDPNDEPADKLLARIKAARLEAEMLEKAAKKAAKASKK